MIIQVIRRRRFYFTTNCIIVSTDCCLPVGTSIRRRLVGAVRVGAIELRPTSEEGPEWYKGEQRPLAGRHNSNEQVAVKSVIRFECLLCTLSGRTGRSSRATSPTHDICPRAKDVDANSRTISPAQQLDNFSTSSAISLSLSLSLRQLPLQACFSGQKLIRHQI